MAGYSKEQCEQRRDSSYGAKSCVVCGESFTPKGPAQKSCSRACAKIQTLNRRKGVEPEVEAPSFGCADCIVHGSECPVLFSDAAAAAVGCNPLDYPEPVFA